LRRLKRYWQVSCTCICHNFINYELIENASNRLSERF
jgi:hypothetical protein